jgi:hypothetical protein
MGAIDSLNWFIGINACQIQRKQTNAFPLAGKG